MSRGRPEGPVPVGWARALAGALVPGPAPWAVVPALRVVAIGLAVLIPGLLLGAAQLTGVAYLAVACTALFAGNGDYRVRTVRAAGQALGAAIGLTVGAVVPGSPAFVVGAAVVVAAVAGAVGTVGPAATAGAVMAVVGMAYSQFGRLALEWWQPACAYVAGSALLLAASLVGSLVHPQRHRRSAVAAVFDDAAHLVRSLGTPAAEEARHRLALASATAREAMVALRFGALSRDPVSPWWVRAQEAAARAAHEAVAPRLTPAAAAELAGTWESDRDAVRAGTTMRSPADAPTLPDLRHRVRAAAHRAIRRDAVLQGVRLAACIGAATGVAVLLHPPQHAYWIPLTVAMVVRPEYGSVLARSVHRLVGTIGGAVLVAVVVVVAPRPVPLIVAAACALGLAVLANARLYGLAVVGITGSALLSIALSDPRGIDPGARLLDTVLGCAIAVAVGLLAWPARGLPDQHRALATSTAALAAHLGAALDLALPVSTGAATRDESYRQAHSWRAELERALSDPTGAAEDWLPVAVAVERAVDTVSAAGDRLTDRRIHAGDGRALLDLLRSIGASSTPGEALARLAEFDDSLRPLVDGASGSG